jgi:hypothetical protein
MNENVAYSKVLDCTNVKCITMENTYLKLDANGKIKSVNRRPCCRMPENRMRNCEITDENSKVSNCRPTVVVQ